MGKRHASGLDAVEQGDAHRSVTLRGGDGLRGGGPASARGLAAVSLPNAGLWEKLAARFEWDSRGKLFELRAGRSDSKGIVVRLHAKGSLRFIRLWRRLGTVANPSAGDLGERPGGERRRSGDCHFWTLVLVPGRCD